jgi:hypothetical protein
MKWNPSSRRLFLQGAGGAFLTLPWLESMKPNEARAAGPARKRFIAMKTYNHPVITKWYPSTPIGDYKTRKDGTLSLTKPVEPGSKAMFANLSEIAMGGTGISTNLGPFLNKHLEKLTLLRGMDFLPDTNHNYSAWLGNYASCDEATPVAATLALPKWPTIDQVLAYSSKFYPTPPAERSMHVGQGIFKGVQWSDGGNRMGSVTQGSTTTNPLDVYNKMFATFSGTGMPIGMQDTRTLRDANLIDRVGGDFNRLKTNRRLSAKDKQFLDQYATLWADMHNRLKNTKPVLCSKPGAPAASPGNTGQDRMDIKAKWDAFIDLIVASIMCDRTRIATLDVRKVQTAGAALYHNPDGVGGSWHGAAHRWGSADQQAITEGHTWAAENVFLKLVAKLDVPEEGGGTYLDNSLIYWGGELGFNHINYSVLCMLAGSAGGFIKTGRYIDYIDWTSKAYFGQFGGTVIRGMPHNQLCVTILQAMGLAPADYERPGISGFGETKTTNKNPMLWATDYDMGKIGQILPGIRG